MTIAIVPSILAADQAELARELHRIHGAVDRLHVDVMDDRFVANRYGGLELVHQLRGLTSLALDCHLAIVDPDERAVGFAEAGASCVTVHLEATNDPVGLARRVRGAGAKVGLALCPWTSIEAARPHLSAFDTLMLVTVNPGFGGQRMLDDAPARIAAARKLLHDDDIEIRLEVDGGVDVRTIQRCRDAGADSFVAGTAVFGMPDPVSAVEQLRRAAAETM